MQMHISKIETPEYDAFDFSILQARQVAKHEPTNEELEESKKKIDAEEERSIIANDYVVSTDSFITKLDSTTCLQTLKELSPVQCQQTAIPQFINLLYHDPTRFYCSKRFPLEMFKLLLDTITTAKSTDKPVKIAETVIKKIHDSLEKVHSSCQSLYLLLAGALAHYIDKLGFVPIKDSELHKLITALLR